MIDQAVRLDLHEGSTSFSDALGLPLSLVQAYFDAPAFTRFEKHIDAKNGMQRAVVERLDGVIKSIGFLGKALSRRR